MKYAVCRLIWESKGYTYKTVSPALQGKLPGREGLAVSSLQRHVKLGDEAPPDVVEAIRSLPLEPDCDPEGAEIVRLGLDALERGPIIDPGALAASLQAKLPKIDPEVIAAAVTAKIAESDELANKVAAEVVAQQPDSFEVAWKAAAEVLAQEPKPPSPDEVVAKLVATLEQQPKPPSTDEVMAKLVATMAEQPRPPSAEEVAAQVRAAVTPFRVSETKIARYVARHLGRLVNAQLDAATVKIDTTHGRIDNIDAKVDGIDGKLDATHRKVDGVQSTLNQTEAKVDAFAAKLDHNRRALWLVGGLVVLAAAPSSVASILRWRTSSALTSSAPAEGIDSVGEAARQRSQAFAEDHHLGSFASGSGEMGEKAPPERWIPKQPLPYQKLAPDCDAGIGERAINGGCWVALLDVKPPCGRLFREGNICYRPVAADPQRPVGATP